MWQLSKGKALLLIISACAASTSSSSTPAPLQAEDALKQIYIIRHGEKILGDSSMGELATEAQCLSEKGWARAYHLMSIFGPRPRPPFKTPGALFSANYVDPIDCRDSHGWFRTQQTVAPLAADSPSGLNLVVDNSTGYMPNLCNLAWNASAKPGYASHKSTGQPEPFSSELLEWLAAQPTGGTCSPHGYGGGDPICCNAAAAHKMLSTLKSVDAILVAWEHVNIQYLAQALGAPADVVPSWKHEDFDSIYVLSFDAAGNFQGMDTSHTQGFESPTVSSHSGSSSQSEGLGDEERGNRRLTYLGAQTGCGAVFHD